MAFVCNTSVDLSLIKSIVMVPEFMDVFPADLPCVPPIKDIDFSVDVELGTKPTSIPLYHMALLNSRS